MTEATPLLFGLYEQASVGIGGAPGMWTHPQDERLGINSLDYWTDLARTAEQANLDVFFFGDVLGLYDVYGGNHEAAVRWAVEAPANDPLMLVPALAALTKHLAFGITASTSYEHPFSHARRFSTLDHLSRGRVGWNVVTSYLTSAARNFGLEEMIKHDDRYDRAEEFLDVVYKLWEGSWADDAVVGDKLSPEYARGDRVRPINHVGTHYSVAGPHLSAPSPQRTPVLIQAGWSPRGRAFAAKHAEVILIGGGTIDSIAAGLIDIDTQAQALGRGPDAVKSMTLCRVVTAETDIAAQAKFDDLQSNYHLEAQLVSYAGDTGFDLSRYADNEPLVKQTEGLSSYAHTRDRSGTVVTAGDLRKKFSSLTRGTDLFFVGSPESVADQIAAHASATGLSGYMLNQIISPGTVDDFATFVVPELIKRGLYAEAPHTGTFRSRLRADGADRLPETHHAAAFRFPHTL